MPSNRLVTASFFREGERLDDPLETILARVGDV